MDGYLYQSPYAIKPQTYVSLNSSSFALLFFIHIKCHVQTFLHALDAWAVKEKVPVMASRTSFPGPCSAPEAAAGHNGRDKTRPGPPTAQRNAEGGRGPSAQVQASPPPLWLNYTTVGTQPCSTVRLVFIRRFKHCSAPKTQKPL
jgi:hypothetical protein